jgi:hypothetical protein
MAKSENKLELIKENMAARALIAGICPVEYQKYPKRIKRNTVKRKNTYPKK